jgi:hypothetical protein
MPTISNADYQRIEALTPKLMRLNELKDCATFEVIHTLMPSLAPGFLLLEIGIELGFPYFFGEPDAKESEITARDTAKIVLRTAFIGLTYTPILLSKIFKSHRINSHEEVRQELSNLFIYNPAEFSKLENEVNEKIKEQERRVERLDRGNHYFRPMFYAFNTYIAKELLGASGVALTTVATALNEWDNFQRRASLI